MAWPLFVEIRDACSIRFGNTTEPDICKPNCKYKQEKVTRKFNPLNTELNPICYLLALLAHHFVHVSRIRVKSLTLRLLMSFIYIYIYIYTWSTYSWCF